MVVVLTVSDMPVETSRTGQTTNSAEPSPKYTMPAMVEMTSLSIPLLLRSSRFSKYSEVIDASIFSPDYPGKSVSELLPI